MQSTIVLFLVLTLTACGFPGVYRINVQQGNIVEQKMLDQLKVGMTRAQVHYVMGTPVVEFGLQRELERFLYTYQRGGEEELTQQLVTIYYQDDIVTAIDNDGLLDEHPAY